MVCCGNSGCPGDERPIKLEPAVEMKGIRQVCLFRTFGDVQPKKEFYAGTPPYPERPFIVVD